MFLSGIGLLVFGSLLAGIAVAFNLIPLAIFGTGILIAGAVIATGSEIRNAIDEK